MAVQIANACLLCWSAEKMGGASCSAPDCFNPLFARPPAHSRWGPHGILLTELREACEVTELVK